jgi:hypothetical protein
MGERSFQFDDYKYLLENLKTGEKMCFINRCNNEFIEGNIAEINGTVVAFKYDDNSIYKYIIKSTNLPINITYKNKIILENIKLP